jgi:hypothetical protein
MSKKLTKIALGLLLAALIFIGSAASVAVADEGAPADPNTVQPAE